MNCPICGTEEAPPDSLWGNFVRVTNRGAGDEEIHYWFCHICQHIITLGDLKDAD